MIISCPYCGPRDLVEFAYQGDANRVRPDPSSADQAAWNDYVYARRNPVGPHREIWQHIGGCRVHLVLLRNTMTHEILETHALRPGIGPETGTPARAGEAA